MENAAKIIRDLATLYGIEILDHPTGHLVVDENGIESPLQTADIRKIFGLPTERISNFEFLGQEKCVTINNQHSKLIVRNNGLAVFNTSKNIEAAIDSQYLMAA